MKVQIRIPTEQYGYIEMEGQMDSFEEALTAHDAALLMYKGGKGMLPLDFNKVLDRYLWGDGSMLSEEYEAMNKVQQEVIQCIKRSKNRQK